MGGGKGRGGPDTTPIDAELERAGGFGLMQIYTLVTILLAIMSSTLIVHCIAMLELKPKEPTKDNPDQEPGYICSKKGQPDYLCSPDDFCGDDSITYEVNFDGSDENVYNWYTKLGLVCKDDNATAFLLTGSMVGFVLGVVFVPRLGDLFGRKLIVQIALIESIPCLVVYAIATTPLAVQIAGFFQGPAFIAKIGCGFLMLLEHMPTHRQPAIGAVIMVS